MTSLCLIAIAAPLVAAGAVAAAGWRRWTAALLTVAPLVVLGCGAALAAAVGRRPHLAVDRLLRADSLGATMLVVIGAVGALSCGASVAYLRRELAHGQTSPRRARRYGALVGVFVAAMSLAVLANNLGVLWVAIEATTLATAFLVGHRPSRAALEATWKYVVICSLGISLAFLGTVLLYAASVHAGGGGHALDLDVLAQRASTLDPSVTRLAAGLILLGYGTKMGLAPMHTWLADAHSQAPAPVSALMSGVLLSVAFTALLRTKAIFDTALGTSYLRTGLLIVGLATILIATLLLVGQRDVKRMLAYSSMENMGVLAVATAAGSKLALAAVLLQVLAHGFAKSVLFICAGELQHAHDSTTISDLSAVLARSRLLGAAFSAGIVAVLGLPPFALFASELSISRALAEAHLGWALAVVAVLLTVAFVALAANAAQILFGTRLGEAPAISVPATTAVVLVVGTVACLALGVTAQPLTHLLEHAATEAGGSP